jgi:hypothetical protein
VWDTSHLALWNPPFGTCLVIGINGPAGGVPPTATGPGRGCIMGRIDAADRRIHRNGTSAERNVTL